MITKEYIINYLRQNKVRIYNQYHVSKIGLFGSFARNDETESSDIDIILEFENNTEDLYLIKKNLRDELQAQFNKPVDICREKYIKPVFRKEILSQAVYV
jgi:predicted nucleotidyltransferase